MRHLWKGFGTSTRESHQRQRICERSPNDRPSVNSNRGSANTALRHSLWIQRDVRVLRRRPFPVGLPCDLSRPSAGRPSAQQISCCMPADDLPMPDGPTNSSPPSTHRKRLPKAGFDLSAPLVTGGGLDLLGIRCGCSGFYVSSEQPHHRTIKEQHDYSCRPADFATVSAPPQTTARLPSFLSRQIALRQLD